MDFFKDLFSLLRGKRQLLVMGNKYYLIYEKDLNKLNNLLTNTTVIKTTTILNLLNIDDGKNIGQLFLKIAGAMLSNAVQNQSMSKIYEENILNGEGMKHHHGKPIVSI